MALCKVFLTPSKNRALRIRTMGNRVRRGLTVVMVVKYPAMKTCARENIDHFTFRYLIHFSDSGVGYSPTITTFSNLYDGNTVCTVFTNNNNVDRLFCICICFDFVYRVVSIKSNIYSLATSFRILLCACACTVECT